MTDPHFDITDADDPDDPDRDDLTYAAVATQCIDTARGHAINGGDTRAIVEALAGLSAAILATGAEIRAAHEGIRPALDLIAEAAAGTPGWEQSEPVPSHDDDGTEPS